MMALSEKIIAYSERDPLTGCWVWQRTILHNGYGQICLSDRTKARAHRVAYECFVGPIPDGLQIDHLCRNRGCVNPAHLEPVTARENVMRGQGFASQNARKTECPRGHAYTPENIYWHPRGCRICLKCKRAAEVSRRAANRADAA